MQSIQSVWGKLAISLCSLMWTATGWWIIFSGGFTKSYKFSNATTFVDGKPAVLMAYLFFALGTIGAYVAVQSWNPNRSVYGMMATLIIGVPTLYLIFR